MQDQELKQAILDDIEFLKTIKVDIVDKKTYYRKIKKYALSMLFAFYIPVVVLGLFFANYNFASSRGHILFSYPYDRGCVIGGFIISFLMTIGSISKLNKWIVFEEKIMLLLFFSFQQVLYNEGTELLLTTFCNDRMHSNSLY